MNLLLRIPFINSKCINWQIKYITFCHQLLIKYCNLAITNNYDTITVASYQYQPNIPSIITQYNLDLLELKYKHIENFKEQELESEDNHHKYFYSQDGTKISKKKKEKEE